MSPYNFINDFRMILTDLSTFLRRKGTTVERAEAYDQFLQWVPTLGMFIPCAENGDILTEGFSRKAEYEKAKDLVIFKNFVIDDYGEGYVCVTNGSCYLIFQGDNITDESDGMSLNVRWIEDLIDYELEVTLPL
jgi:hypothetical protein